MAKTQNALILIPNRNTKVIWEKNENIISLKISRDGFMDKIIHKIFKTPRLLTLELDELGSFVWEECDGNRNLHEISEDLKNHFGEKSDPALERLLKYIKILKKNSLVELE